jgi:HrpA-like RNA helicase
MDSIGMLMIHSIVIYLEENINKILNEEDGSENRLNSYLKEVNNSKYSFNELNNPWKMGTLERKSTKKEIIFQEKTISEKEEKILQIDEEILKKRKELPSYKMKNEILKLIENNQVTIVSGSTGCGKSTQVFHLFV